MFKKLKDKIAEEVKQSPLKTVQQLAQAVVSPSSSSVFEPSSSNDKFCIDDGDIKEESGSQRKSEGFTSVALTGQTTSPLRDQGSKYGFRSSSTSLTTEADNLFPIFEPQPSNYHVQSDWESASEVEDRYSQLEHITKESLYEAYRKVYNRYNKTKNKYQELVTHYRHLEKEKEKARTVLSATQDRALLRISELKEQCVLEQQAKAHLEEALRNELEERDHIINTLKTKVQYLKNVNDGSASEGLKRKLELENLIDFTDSTNLTKVPLPLAASNDTDCINWSENQVKKFKDFFNEKSMKIDILKTKIEELKKQNVQVEELCPEMLNASINMDQVIEHDKKEESIIHKALTSIIDDLSKEIKSLQANVGSKLQFDTVTNTTNTQLTSLQTGLFKDMDESNHISFSSGFGDGPHQDLGASDEKAGKVIRVESHDEVTINLRAAIKELEKENMTLKEKFEKESHVTEQLMSELNMLKQTLSVVKTQLETSNAKFVTGILNNDIVNPELSLDNDLMRELNLCLQRLYKTKYDLNSLEDLTKLQEKTLKKTQNEIESLKTENNQLLILKDQLQTEINVECNPLKERLLSLQNDKCSLELEKESLIQEISNLKSKNEELENQMKKTLNSLSILEQECKDKQIHFENSEKCFIEEKKVIQDEVLKLKIEFEKAQENVLSALEEKQKFETNSKLLKNTNSDIINENYVLRCKLDDIEANLETSKQDCKELESKLSHIMLLKEEDNSCIASEKEELHKQIFILEDNLKKSNQGFTLVTQERDLLSKDLASLKKDYDLCDHEKRQIQNKVMSLDQELATCNYNLLTTSEAKQKLADELLVLKKYQEECDLQIKELQNKVVSLTDDAEHYKTRCLSEDEVRQNIIQELESIKKTNENLNVENNSLINKIGLLQDGIVSSEAKVSSKVEEENKLAEELTVLKNELSIKTKDINEMQDKYDNLLKECSKSKKDYMNLLEIKNQLSDQLLSMTNLKNELIVDRNNLQNKFEVLTSDFQNLEEKLANVANSKHKLQEEITSLKTQQTILGTEKSQMKTQIEELETKAKNNETDMVLTLEEKSKMVKEVAILKTKIDGSTKENKQLRENLNNLLLELDQKKIEYTDLIKENVKLVEELASLRKEHCEKCCLLKETIEQLDHQQTLCNNLEKHSSELTQQLSLLNIKYVNIEKQNEENIHIKTDLEQLHKKCIAVESVNEQHTSEKRAVGNIIKKLADVRNIRNQHESLLECVLTFRSEILNELNYLKTKVALDLMDEVNHILQENRQNNELECKRKDEINTYNSKIKYFEEELQKANNDYETQFFSQTSTDYFKGKEQHKKTNDEDSQRELCSVIRSGSIEDISKLSGKSAYYQNKCFDLEINLKQAYTILKCLSNSFFKRDSEKNIYFNGDDFLLQTDDNGSINNIEQKDVEKQLAALKIFLNDYEEKQIIDSMDLSNMDPNSVPAFLDNNNGSIIKSEVCENLSLKKNPKCKSSEINDSSKINQLLQEIQLKDDIIKELQCLVEEHEKQSVVVSSFQNLQSNQPELLNYSEIDDCNKCSIEKHNNYFDLEEENKSLLQKIQQLQQVHESTMKTIKAEYEELLQEKDEHNIVCEKEEMAFENKFIVNELKEQIGNLQQDLDERGDAFEKLYEEHKETLKEKDSEVQKVRSNFEKEMREQDKKWRSCLDRRLTEEEKRHEAEVTELTLRWSAERKELETASRLAVSVVESGSSSSDMLRRQVQALTMQLNQLQQIRCEDCEHQKSFARRKSISSSRSIQDCTEMEYLRNILYEYMMGKEPLVLAKVLCALVKFDETQTQDIVMKEKQRITVLGQLGIPL